MKSQLLFRWIECLSLYVIVPLLFVLGYIPIPLIPVLLLMAGVSYVVLHFDKTFDKKWLSNSAGLKKNIVPILVLFTISIPFLTAFAYFFYNDFFLNFVLQRPHIWIMVMVFYPLFSVVPQGFIYRAFFMHRYAQIFPNTTGRMIVSAILFSYGHLIFMNWTALALTLIGGLIFVWRYQKSQSMLASNIEHALYGNLVFTLGIGVDFFLGNGG